MTYNTMYENLVDNDENTIQGFVAYCLYKHGKREWIRQFETQNQRPPSSDELKTYVSTYTSQPIAAVQTQAAGILAAFADSAINDAKAGIVEDALKGSNWNAIWTGVVSAFVYTVLLLVVLFILKHAGVDVIGIANSVGS